MAEVEESLINCFEEEINDHSAMMALMAAIPDGKIHVGNNATFYLDKGARKIVENLEAIISIALFHYPQKDSEFIFTVGFESIITSTDGTTYFEMFKNVLINISRIVAALKALSEGQHFTVHLINERSVNDLRSILACVNVETVFGHTVTRERLYELATKKFKYAPRDPYINPHGTFLVDTKFLPVKIAFDENDLHLQWHSRQ